MAYTPPNTNGQNTSANSAPVVLASDQSALPISGKFNASQPTLTDGTLTNVQFDSRGNLKVAISQANTSGNNMVIANPGDGEVVGSASVNVKSRTMLYNGTTFDLARSSGPIGTTAVAGSFAEQTGLSAAALNANLVPSTDVSAYKSFSLAIAGTWVGTLTFQGSNDNTTWYPIVAFNTSDALAQSGSTASGNSIKVGNLYHRYLRVQMTSYTSGTATGVLELYTMPFQFNTMGVAASLNAGSNTVGAVTQSGNWATSPSVNAAGLTPFSNQAVTNTPIAVKASQCRMYQYDIYNPNTTGVWIQLFNATVANVTLGTTVPTRTIYIPPSSGRDDEATYSINWGTALTIAATTTATNAVAPATPVSVFMGYL